MGLYGCTLTDPSKVPATYAKTVKKDGKETIVFSCFNQDQRLDLVDFASLNDRLRANSVTEKLSDLWLAHLLAQAPELRRI